MKASADYALFALIVEKGGLSAAARHARLSPAMVSKRLARLEERLGAQLIRRTTRRLELTEAGARFHQDVLTILGAIETAESRLAGRQSEPTGSLRISAPTSFGRLYVAPVLARFMAAHPRVEVEFDLTDEFVDLLAKRVDVAVRITGAIGAGSNAEHLAVSRRILCASPDYLARRGAPETVADLHRYDLLAARGQLPWRLVGPSGRMLVDRPSLVSTNSSEVVRELSIAGLGIALRSLWDIGADLTAGRLVRVLSAVEGSADVGIYAMQPRSDYPTASGRVFVALLKDAFQPVPPW